jgi:hypothetical protein
MYGRLNAVNAFLTDAANPQEFCRKNGLEATPERLKMIEGVRNLVQKEMDAYKARRGYATRASVLPRILRPLGKVTNAIQMWREGRVARMKAQADLAKVMDYTGYAKEMVRLYGPKNAGLVVEKLWDLTEDPGTVTKAAVEAGCEEADVKKAVDARVTATKEADARVAELERELEEAKRRGEVSEAKATEFERRLAEIERRLGGGSPPEATPTVPGAPELPPRFSDLLKEAAKRHGRVTVGEGDARWTCELAENGAAKFSGKGWTLEVDATGKVTGSTGTPPEATVLQKALQTSVDVTNKLDLKASHGIVTEARATPVADPSAPPPLVLNEAWATRMRILTSLDPKLPVDIKLLKEELAKAESDKTLTRREVLEIEAKLTQIEEAAKAGRITPLEASQLRTRVREAAVERGRLLREVREIKVR